MFSNLLDEDTSNEIKIILFPLKCYLILIVVLLLTIIYSINKNNLKTKLIEI